MKVLQTNLWREKKKKVDMKNLKLKKAMNTIKAFLPCQTFSFIESQVTKSKLKSKSAYRWKTEDKLLALSIFFHSRKAYQVLSKLFILPSKSTLLHELRKMNIKPGFSASVLEALKMKAKNMHPRDCNVVLAFDEMSIKEGLVYNPGSDIVEGFEDFGSIGQTRYIANHSIAFMVRGLASKWKQPIGYFLSSGPIKPTVLDSLVKECLDKLEETGLKVVALVCDQGSNNRSFLQNINRVSLHQPYLQYGERKIFVFYDPPHLLKNVRNNLKKCNFEMNGKIISWKHIVDFYNFDKAQPIQMAPKLKDKHINLPPFTAMRVNLAAQVLSHSVAAGLATMVTFKKLPSDAIHTAHFVEHFDALFNTFNSFALKSTQRLRHAFNDSSGHHAFLRDSSNFLATIKTVNGKELPCLFGWRLCINALLGLWQYLKTAEKFNFLYTSRLNQDCVENLFCVIRGRGGFRDNPDVQQFQSAFKYVVANKLFMQSTSSNCQVDSDKLLLDISHVAMGKYLKPNVPIVQRPCGTDIASVMKPALSIETRNIVTYMAGYLLRKIPVNKCSECTSQLLIEKPLANEDDQRYEFVKNKALKEIGSLLYPTPCMISFVEDLENTFNTTFEYITHMPSVLGRLCKCADKYCSFLDCQANECLMRLKGMVKLYMKVRIFHALKKSNTQNVETKGLKRNRKMLKLSHL